MINIIGLEHSEQWDEIVKSFKEYDVYYLSGYAKAFQIHGDGIPILVYVERSELRGMCVYIKREISLNKRSRVSEKNQIFDLITPYGYGGFLFDGADKSKIDAMLVELQDYFFKEGIVSEFVRWHPLLNNVDSLRGKIDIIDLGHTIHMDLTSKETIWQNITSKNRNTIRRAQKCGIVIHHKQERYFLSIFNEIYNSTRRKDNAEEYYYFEDAFYDSIHSDLKNNYELFYAEIDGKIIAMAIILFANRKMHYHLSGSLVEYRNLNPTNLLLYEVACWGAEQGFETFHLGGGLGASKDNLYNFKAAFHRYAANQFSISKMIYNQGVYDYLVNERIKESDSFDTGSHFFPLYRSGS